jgi:hypothetical protein
MNELKNTDKEIWREIEGEYYSPSIFVTEQGKIGINVGGNVYVQSVEKWHQQADRIAELEKVSKPVAWMDYLEHSDVYDLNVSGRGIPLYTTPQIKEFTQAELKEIVEHNTKYDYVDYFNLALDMNKAILKKASEK